MTGWDVNVDVSGWDGWLSNARLAANLVTVAAAVSVARVLWSLSGGDEDAARRHAPRLLIPFASLIALCGVSHLVVVIAGQSHASVLPTALKVLAAALWVVTAARFRSAADHRPPHAGAGDEDEAARQCEDCARFGLAMKIERLKIKVRGLENMILNETHLPDSSAALKELREILADLEARQCKI